jgi:uncharacterized protein YegP (UPF0339 family)
MMRKPKFEIRDNNYFVLVAPNGKVILVSEIYNSLQAVRRGIRSVKKNAYHDYAYKKLVAIDTSYYFTVRARNNKVVGVSEMYKTRAGRWFGIRSVMRNAPKATIVVT